MNNLLSEFSITFLLATAERDQVMIKQLKISEIGNLKCLKLGQICKKKCSNWTPGRKVVRYSYDLLSKLPIKFLLVTAERDQVMIKQILLWNWSKWSELVQNCPKSVQNCPNLSIQYYIPRPKLRFAHKVSVSHRRKRSGYDKTFID